MRKIFTAIIAFTLLTSLAILPGCTDANGAQQVLEGAGYTNVKTTGYAFFGCSDQDSFHTGFLATGQNGKPVKGVVCSGWLKGYTIRVTG